MFLIIALATFCLLIYLLNQHYHSFWTKLGFPQLEPKFLVGNIAGRLSPKSSLGEFFQVLYNNNKHKSAVGIYFSYSPALLINDPILIQKIFISDFSSFHDRPVPFDLDNEPLTAHLFNLKGKKWRDLRVKLSPTFTSGKLKGMFSTITSCGQVLEDYLVKNVENGVDVFEFRDLMARWTTNIISSVAFGIETDCINERDHIFRKMGARNFETTLRVKFGMFLAFFIPKLIPYIKFKLMDPEVEAFIISIVKQTVDHREKNNVERNDFMQLLMQLKNQGFVSADKEENVGQEVQKLTFLEMAAQVFVFFIAGYETSSSTMSYCLYELAQHKNLQRKVQQEIDGVLKTGKLSYESLHELKFLERCIDETLRKYPIVPLLMRECTEDYKLPDSDLVIPKGMGLMIPVMGLHRDPEIYEDPLEFKPDRFLNSPNGDGKSEGTFYLPFGDGPRNCIGMRLGKVTTKLGIAIVLSKFSIELCDESIGGEGLKFDTMQFILTPTNKFNIILTPRKAE